MLDFNDVSIKGSDDLAEALKTEMSVESFISQVKGMFDRWGIDSSLSMMYYSLYGDEGLNPLIKCTHQIVDNFDKSGDPFDYSREKIKGAETVKKSNKKPCGCIEPDYSNPYAPEPQYCNECIPY